MFRRLYQIWRAGGSTEPSPFGSLYILDSLLPKNSFDFFHSVWTGTIGINMNETFLVVFIWDQGDAYRANILNQWISHHQKVYLHSPVEHKDQLAYLAQHAWACECAYWLYCRRRLFKWIRVGKKLVLLPPFRTSISYL
jgi:hypothetical protein